METDLYREAMALLEAGDVENGRRLMEEAYRKEPESPEVLHGLARALDAAGERVRALELFERVNALHPTDPGPACDLAMLYLEREEDDRAARVLEPVLQAHPEHPRANLHMALALAKTQPGRARGYVAQALEDGDPETQSQAKALDRVLAANAPG